MRNTFYFKQDAWYKDRLVEFRFPDNWQIQEFKPNTPPVIDTEQIRSKIIKSDAGKDIGDLYKRTMKVLLIGDDITRPTRTDILLPVLLEVLHSLGMKKRMYQYFLHQVHMITCHLMKQY